MFTGLVTTCGVLHAKTSHEKGTQLRINADFVNLVQGESIAVNGVCLTLTTSEASELVFDVSPETLNCTALAALAVGQRVHLERALKVSDRLGGHYVTGHVDKCAAVSKITPKGEYLEMEIGGFTAADMPYLCMKGSVTLDGVSLTINAVHATSICIMLVPHTLLKTTLSTWQVGTRVHVEFDYVARVIVHQLGSLKDSTIISLFERPVAGSEV